MNTYEAVPETATTPLTEPAPLTATARAALVETLILRHKRELIYYVQGRVRSWADACEIVQQVFCNVFFRSAYAGGIRHPRGYLFEAARHLADEFIEKEIARKAVARDVAIRADHQSPSSEELYLAREEWELLATRIEALPRKARNAFVLVRFQHFSYEEVAFRLGIKPASARRLVERAMDYLLATVSQESLSARGEK